MSAVELLAKAMKELLREAAPRSSPPPPAPPAPEWVLCDVEAVRRGFVHRDGRPNLERFYAWCKRAGVPVKGEAKRHGNHWVRPQDVDAAVDRIPLSAAGRAVKRAQSESSVDDLIAFAKKKAAAPRGKKK